eukprot:3003590-Heterocapsa_arctica.AAC.1
MPVGPFSPEDIAAWRAAQGSVDTADRDEDVAQPQPLIAVDSGKTFNHFDPALATGDAAATGDARFAGNHPFHIQHRLLVHATVEEMPDPLVECLALTDHDVDVMHHFAHGQCHFFEARLERLR